MPILHEPKFMRNVQERLHHRNPHFGRLVMMMCALSSRNLDDPRVLLPGQHGYSAGWKYYEQVQVIRQWMFEAPSLHEIQVYCVSIVSSINARITANKFSKVGCELLTGHIIAAECLDSCESRYSIVI